MWPSKRAVLGAAGVVIAVTIVIVAVTVSGNESNSVDVGDKPYSFAMVMAATPDRVVYLFRDSQHPQTGISLSTVAGVQWTDWSAVDVACSSNCASVVLSGSAESFGHPEEPSPPPVVYTAGRRSTLPRPAGVLQESYLGYDGHGNSLLWREYANSQGSQAIVAVHDGHTRVLALVRSEPAVLGDSSESRFALSDLGNNPPRSSRFRWIRHDRNGFHAVGPWQPGLLQCAAVDGSVGATVSDGLGLARFGEGLPAKLRRVSRSAGCAAASSGRVVAFGSGVASDSGIDDTPVAVYDSSGQPLGKVTVPGRAIVSVSTDGTRFAAVSGGMAHVFALGSGPRRRLTATDLKSVAAVVFLSDGSLGVLSTRGRYRVVAP